MIKDIKSQLKKNIWIVLTKKKTRAITLPLRHAGRDAKIVGRPVEMKKFLGGGLRIMKYYRPPWLADEKKFAFQIV